jgi:hypothetical protein
MNLAKIEDFSMRYLYKNCSECYDCVQVENSMSLSPENQTIRATLKAKEGNVNLDQFDIIIAKKDNKYSIKSDFFEEESKFYPLHIFKGDDEYILMADFVTEVMYLHAQYA